MKIKSRFGKGIRVAWYRDFVRPKILDTEPTKGLTYGGAEVHVLTSKADWMNLLWTLRSFYMVCEHPYRLAIHEDGSLGEEELETIARLYPDARIIHKQEADLAVFDALQAYPRALELRTTNALSQKLFDFPQFLESERMILLDSDVLFFSRPDVLLDRIQNPEYNKNTVNGDTATAMTIEPKAVEKRFGFPMLERFNSGLGLIHTGSLRLEWIEEFLDMPGIIGHFWRIEQTLIAMCSCRFGAELLPPEYDVYLEKGLGNRPCRHYVGAVRHLMYSEGMRRLSSSTGFVV